jgi:hypothetical protein
MSEANSPNPAQIPPPAARVPAPFGRPILLSVNGGRTVANLIQRAHDRGELEERHAPFTPDNEGIYALAVRLRELWELATPGHCVEIRISQVKPENPNGGPSLT